MIVLNYTEMRIYCQRQRCSPRCGFWRYKSYADIRRDSLVRWCEMRVRSSKMRVFSFDRSIFRMKFPSGFTYRNLHGFARFPCNSTAFVLLAVAIYLSKVHTWYQNYYVWVCSPPMPFHRHRNRWPWMTLNSRLALNTVFRVESFSMDTLVLRHDCF